MPPKEQLPKEKMAMLTKWVEMGSRGRRAEPEPVATVPNVPAEHVPPKVTPETMKFWSYQPVHRPAVPQVKERAGRKNPIDEFILREAGGERGCRTRRRRRRQVLLRRAYYDLTGLPPTPEEVDAFVADDVAGCV